MPFHLAIGLGWPEVIGITAIAWILLRFFALRAGRTPELAIADDFIVWLARGFDTGLLPKGPGTWGSVVGVGWFALLASFQDRNIYIVGMVLGVAASVVICERAEKILKQHDPSSVVLDEIVALPVCFFPWIMHQLYSEGRMPPVGHFFSGTNWLGVLAIFGLFRLFDIRKPGPIGKIQRLKGGWGVTADDILAGVATALIVASYFLLQGRL